ncbi:DnaB-like helicase C-terminal domain-containing protein [Pelobacter propionicus]|uniref:DNA 5'-3' helicase n=1 Tax=Pelobacter propionicus (strain DSM 2379 / NBRC 103807 / OttBd1) TaxID=338966 RepID=A1ATP9_PELPD|nr:DnaB-like helicase C-terminal domain-containing protein [Pelobacter propionicus]ABL00720.1 DnaB domain protein helicase, C-terminal domain protein [Pelobacter propionicus DSM 2379]
MNQFTDPVAEQEIVGAVLTDPDSFTSIRPIVTPEMFSNLKLETVYRTFSEQYEKNGLTDLATLAEISGVPGHVLVGCMAESAIPSLVHIKARKIADQFHKRHIQRQLAITIAQLGTLTPAEIAAALSNLAADVTIRNHEKSVFSPGELCKRVSALQKTREQERKEGRHQGADTGYPVVQQLLKGLAPKRMTVIAAATGFGKSTLALNLLYNTTTSGHRALFITNENDVDTNLDRLAAIHSGIRLKELEQGGQHRAAISFGEQFHNSGLFMTDNSPRTVEEIVGIITRHAIQHKIKVAFVDYIGEITPSGESSRDTEEARLARYAQRLVDCAKSLELHVVVMAQLNRQGNTKGRPTRAELAGCFKIAQKAHSLLLFWQDEKKRDVLTVDKNRQGPSGIDIHMDFDRTTQRIRELCVLTAD